MNKSKVKRLNIVLALFLIVGMLLALSGATGAAGKLTTAVNNFIIPDSLSLVGEGNAVFGNDIVGNWLGLINSNVQSVTYFVCNNAGTITDIGAYIKGVETGYAQAALYDGTGVLLRQSSIVAIGTDVSWVDFPIPHSYTTVVGQTYGLALLGDVAIQVAMVQGAGSRTGGPGYRSFNSGFSDPFGDIWYSTAGGMSIYASGTSFPTSGVSLMMGVSGQGSVYPSIGLHTYDANYQVSIFSTASNGYEFSYWVFNDLSKSYSPSLILTMSVSRSALAVFTAISQPTPTPAPGTTPNPNPTATPAPTVEPTPLPTSPPIENPTPTPEPIDNTPYVDVNESALVGGLSMCAVTALGFAVNNGFLGKKR